MPDASTDLAAARVPGTAAAFERPRPDVRGRQDIPPCWGEGLAVVAHELRNPLATILLSLPTIPDDRAAARPLALVERQARRAVRIIDDLYDVCAGSLGKLTVCPEVLDLAAVVWDSARAVEPLLLARRHQLTVSLPPRPVAVVADPVRLEQILTNLLTNAAKFTDAGGHVRLTVEASAGQVVLRVRDNGHGIAPDMVPRVFDLFHQGAGPGEHRSGGLGVGLALVKVLTELHGGTIAASSGGPGTGSEFVVRLPLVATPRPRARPGGPPTRPAGRSDSTEVVVTERAAPREERPRPDSPAARIIRPLELASHATAAGGVSRLPAITHELVGADSLGMGVTTLDPDSGVGPHRGDIETGIYVVTGRIRLRWGERLESAAELADGDIAFVPPRVPHEETNLSADRAAVLVVAWSRRPPGGPPKPDAGGTHRPHRPGR